VSITMNQAAAGTAASLVGYIPPAGYMAALGTSPVYLGTGPGVTVSNGFQVPSSAPLVWQNSLGGSAVAVYAVASATAQTFSYGFGNGPAGQVIAGGTAALQLDQSASDIQPVGLAASAGSSGLAADAKHVHTVPLTTPGDLLTVSAGTALTRLGAGTAGTMLGVSGGLPAWQLSMTRQAATTVAGTALVNGTPTMLSWTAPNDGQQHRAQVMATLRVTSTETGGVISVGFTTPDGSSTTLQLIAGAQSAGVFTPNPPRTLICGANTAVSVQQTSALTGGAATLWAEIWGS
jgi:hypothetical protein